MLKLIPLTFWFKTKSKIHFIWKEWREKKLEFSVTVFPRINNRWVFLMFLREWNVQNSASVFFFTYFQLLNPLLRNVWPTCHLRNNFFLIGQFFFLGSKSLFFLRDDRIHGSWGRQRWQHRSRYRKFFLLNFWIGN